MIARQGGERLRFFLLRTHYRSTIVFGEEPLSEAGTALDTFHRFFERFQRVAGNAYFDLDAPTRRSDGQITPGTDKLLGQISQLRDRFLTKMDDDFNTGAAVSELFELVRMLNKFADQQQLEDADQRKPNDL